MTQRAPVRNTQSDPVQLVENLTQIAVRLDEVLSAETDVLKNRKPAKVVDFHEEKTRLTNELALQVNAIRKAPHLVDRAPAERVKSLKAAMATLHKHSDQNSKLLIAAKSVPDGIVRTVAAVAARQRTPQTGYGKSGAMADSGRSGMSLSLDARV